MNLAACRPDGIAAQKTVIVESSDDVDIQVTFVHNAEALTTVSRSSLRSREKETQEPAPSIKSDPTASAADEEPELQTAVLFDRFRVLPMTYKSELKGTGALSLAPLQFESSSDGDVTAEMTNAANNGAPATANPRKRRYRRSKSLRPLVDAVSHTELQWLRQQQLLFEAQQGNFPRPHPTQGLNASRRPGQRPTLLRRRIVDEQPHNRSGLRVAVTGVPDLKTPVWAIHCGVSRIEYPPVWPPNVAFT